MQGMMRWWWVLFMIPLLAAGGFVIWAESTPEPMPQATAALETPAQTDGLAVTTHQWLTFRPTTEQPASGLIFYPGGRVDSLGHNAVRVTGSGGEQNEERLTFYGALARLATRPEDERPKGADSFDSASH